MPVNFGVELSSAGRLLRVFERLARVADRRLYGRVGDVIVALTKARFQTKTDPEGIRWKKWSKEYAKTRGAGHSLLVGDTHKLERGIEARIAGSRLTIGVMGADYAAAVHRKRPFMGLGPREELLVMRSIEDRMMEAIDGAA
jgi:phage gpG-like protein